MTKNTKPNALWNTIKFNIEEAVKKDKDVKRLSDELVTLKTTEDNLSNIVGDICKTFSDKTDVVKELHTNAISHIDTLQGQITESTSTIMTIYHSINEIPSALKTLHDEQHAASTSYKAVTGAGTEASTNRHKGLTRVREAIHSYQQAVDKSEGLHANAKLKINELQGKLKATQSVTKEISDTIEGHSPSMKKLMNEHGKANSEHQAAILVTSNKKKELKDAVEIALEGLADEITTREGRRAIKKALINAMDKKFEFKNWTCNDPKYNRQLWPQVEGILCILVNLPTFFSRVELQTLLGYNAGNNNVKLALEYMSEENMLIIKEDKWQTEKYYLGKMARVILGRIIPNINAALPADLAATVQELHANENRKKGLEKVNKNSKTNTADETTAPKVTPQKRKREGESSSEGKEEENEPPTSNSDTPTDEEPHGPYVV